MSEGITYLLPLRSRAGDDDVGSLTPYLRWLSGRADLLIVDGSDPPEFAEHHAAWSSFATHVRPAQDLRCANGKAWGVLTGLRLARNERVVIADDDIRYDEAGLCRMGELLERAELVRPQNYFDPRPWHAHWDTARILINRAIGNDFPGTLGVRRSFLLAADGYDGDVLFENLEMIRTVEALAGRIVDAPSLFVRRLPPTFARFVEQRPRQAYDDWAQPLRFATFLTVVPIVASAGRRRSRALALASGLAILVANAGRFRDRGRDVFAGVSTLFAPAWLAERAVLAWMALARGLVGDGCPYAGSVIRRAATSSRALRRRLHPRSSG